MRVVLFRSSILVAFLTATVWLSVSRDDAHARTFHQTPLFDAPLITPDVGPYPTPFAVADFDRDGADDLVVVWFNYPRSRISYLHGLSNGAFAEPVTIASDDWSWEALAVGDVNEDQRLDIVVQNTYPGSVDVLLGNGDGSFEAPTRYPYTVLGWPQTTLIADLNLDGHLDLALTSSAGAVWLMPGNGDGSFAPAYEASASSGASGAAVGDFDQNGIPDLVFGEYWQDRASVLLGTAAGQFGPPIHLPAGFHPTDVTIGDWNEDGHSDLVIANGGVRCDCCYVIVGDSTVTMYTGNGDGSFTPAPSIETGLYPTSVRLADMDMDQHVDLVVGHDPWGGVICFAGGAVSPEHGDKARSHPLSSTAPSGILGHDPERYPGLSIFRGHGDGSFDTTPWFRTLEAGRDLAVGDWNQDGRPDLMASHKELHNLSVYLGGSRAFAESPAVSVSDLPDGLLSADVDGDALPDLAIACWTAGTVDVVRNVGNRTFAAPVQVPVGLHPADLASADFNSDGIVDFAVGLFGTADSSQSSPQDGELVILRGTGSGQFSLVARLETGGHVSSVRVGDLNADGRPDIVVGHTIPASLATFITDANGHPQRTHTLELDPTHWLPTIGLADFTGDGIFDVAVPLGTDGVTVLPGRGDGSFQPVGFPYPYTTFETLEVSDLNEDGLPDLLGSGWLHSVSRMLGKGNGTFETTPVPVGLYPAWANSADLNGDVIPDLATVSRYSESATVYLGTGNGSFVDRLDYGIGPGAVDAVAEDFDDDGLPDLAIAYGPSSKVRVLWNGATPPAPRAGRVFVEGSQVVSAAPTAAETVLHLEPIDDSYQSADLDRTSLSLESQGTGSISRIFGRMQVPGIEGDVDGNGSADLAVRFAPEDVARLFDRVRGRRSVDVALRGRLGSGGIVVGAAHITVVPAAGLQTYVSSMASGARSTIHVSTTRFGRLKVRLFDVTGRMVRELIDQSFAPAGLHVAEIGGDHGQRLASGVYFYRVEAVEGVRTGRVIVLR